METATTQKFEQSIETLSSSAPQDSSFHHVHIKLEEHEPTSLSTKELILKKAKEACKWNRQIVITFFLKLLPVLEWLPRYRIKEQLLGDVISGLLVRIVAIPQSISYSPLSSQDPIYGLYTNFFCSIIYFVMATSRHNAVGSFGVLCLMIGETMN
ncbi:unnamed protein product [Eretmochelys imbricata]